MIHDVFAQHAMSERGLELSNAVRAKASEMLEMVDKIPSSRETCMAVSRLEEAVMWINKAIARSVE